MNLSSWYPGHMTKAKRMMQADMKLIDLVIELLDARTVSSSRNPDIDELAKGKARLVLLNKCDLADPAVNDLWVEYFKNQGIGAVLLDSKNRKGFDKINGAIETACRERIERNKKKGIVCRPVRAMVVGIPNVGKSTFINSLCKRASTKTGNKPGVTKGKQWIKLGKQVELCDTPGILWPKFEDDETGRDLAFIGSISDDILDLNELSENLLDTLKVRYPGAVAGRFDIDENASSYEMIEEIAKRRGCIRKGGQTDHDKASRMIIDDFRAGKLGRISLEVP